MKGNRATEKETDSVLTVVLQSYSAEGTIVRNKSCLFSSILK